MLGMMVEGQTNLDFTKETSVEQMIGQMKLSNAELKLYRAEKGYKEERNVELFKMMEAGALISKDGALFKTLDELKKQ